MNRSLGWRRPTAEQLKHCKAMRLADPVLSGITAAGSSNNYRYVSKVLNQLSLGSCTANAAAAVIHAKLVSLGHTNAPWLSRLLAYYLARRLVGEEKQDAGSSIALVMECIALFGWVPEDVWPYEIDRFAEMPDTEVFRKAYDQRGNIVTNYHAIEATGYQRIEMVRKALSAGFLVTFGSPVSNEFCNTDPVKPEHVFDLKDAAGGHARTLVGHDDSRELFKVLNSWGPDWHDPEEDAGCSLVGYDFIQWDQVHDLYIVTNPPKGSVV